MQVTVNEETNQQVLKQLSVILNQNPYKEEKDELCLNIHVFRLYNIIFLVFMANLIKTV